MNTPVTINALDNDTPAGTLAVANLTQPANGSAVVNGTSITYTPNNCFTGTDTFTYRASLSGVLSNVATVTVTVTAIPSTTPVAVNDGPVGMTQGTAFVDYNVMANDNAFGRPLRIFSVTQPAAGTGSVAIQSDNVTVRYSPPASLFGTVTFTYRATNDVCAVSANSATVTVRVNGKPVANNVSATAPDNTAVPITLSATDPDGNTPLTYTFTSSPTRGTISNFNATAGTFTYTDTTGTNGTTDSFTYTATDNLGAISNTATVTVTVLEQRRRHGGKRHGVDPGENSGVHPRPGQRHRRDPASERRQPDAADERRDNSPERERHDHLHAGRAGHGGLPLGHRHLHLPGEGQRRRDFQHRDGVGDGESAGGEPDRHRQRAEDNREHEGRLDHQRHDLGAHPPERDAEHHHGPPPTATGAFIATANPDSRRAGWKISLEGIHRGSRRPVGHDLT